MKKLNECSCGCGSMGSCKESGETKNYMFFENLKTIRDSIDALMKMNPKLIDLKLDQGHDWAADHIASAKDDVEEVANFFINKESETHDRVKLPFFKTFESFVNRK